VKGRAILTLFQSSYKSFKDKFIKIQKSDPHSELLEGFPLYWSSHPQSQQSLSPDDLESSEFNDCKKLDDLGIVFETSILLKLEFRPNDLRVYIGIPSYCYLFLSLPVVISLIFAFAENTMLLTKAEMACRMKGASVKHNTKPTSADFEHTTNMPLWKKNAILKVVLLMTRLTWMTTPLITKDH